MNQTKLDWFAYDKRSGRRREREDVSLLKQMQPHLKKEENAGFVF